MLAPFPQITSALLEFSTVDVVKFLPFFTEIVQVEEVAIPKKDRLFTAWTLGVEPTVLQCANNCPSKLCILHESSVLLLTSRSRKGIRSCVGAGSPPGDAQREQAEHCCGSEMTTSHFHSSPRSATGRLTHNPATSLLLEARSAFCALPQSSH